EIIPVINKIDLPNADVEKVTQELVDVVGIDPDDVILASAKDNIGIEEIMEAVVDRIQPPEGSKEEPLKALIFDSLYEKYRSVIDYIYIKEDEIKVGDKIKMMDNKKEYEVLELGVSTTTPVSKDKLNVGKFGFLTAAMKEVKDTEVGDTITKV